MSAHSRRFVRPRERRPGGGKDGKPSGSVPQRTDYASRDAPRLPAAVKRPPGHDSPARAVGEPSSRQRASGSGSRGAAKCSRPRHPQGRPRWPGGGLEAAAAGSARAMARRESGKVGFEPVPCSGLCWGGSGYRGTPADEPGLQGRTRPPASVPSEDRADAPPSRTLSILRVPLLARRRPRRHPAAWLGRATR